ncbi:hypothetical protein TNCV_4528381 [Trichonephila clavipes]|nr:hypothetical protein TNCV_4528381 [Trichonephila clavipes]
MALAAAETISFNSGYPNVPVAINDTWLKRSYNFLNGVVTAVSLDTGKVVDVKILSQKCLYNFNSDVHSDECSASYIVNSRGMEVEEARALLLGLSRPSRRRTPQFGSRWITERTLLSVGSAIILNIWNAHEHIPVLKLGKRSHTLSRDSKKDALRDHLVRVGLLSGRTKIIRQFRDKPRRQLKRDST